MQVKDIQNLIDNKLQPNVAEWTMNVEDALSETGNLISVHYGTDKWTESLRKQLYR